MSAPAELPSPAQAAAPAVPQPSFSAREFRDAMGRFATGVVVVSTEHEGQAHAMTANAFMSGSLAPPLVLVSVAHTARMHARIGSAGRFGISMLAQGQLAVSNHFAGKPTPDHPPRLERLLDVPVVSGAAVQLVAELRHAYPCGDHTLFVGEALVLQQAAQPPQPLLFHAGRYAQLASAVWSADALPQGFWDHHDLRW